MRMRMTGGQSRLCTSRMALEATTCRWGLRVCVSTRLPSGTTMCSWQAVMCFQCSTLAHGCTRGSSCCFCRTAPRKLHLQHSPAPHSSCPFCILHQGRCLALAVLGCICRTLGPKPCLNNSCTEALVLHLQDFIPQEELAKVLAKSGNAADQAQAAQLEQQSRIQADNVGHKCVLQLICRKGTCLRYGCFQLLHITGPAKCSFPVLLRTAQSSCSGQWQVLAISEAGQPIVCCKPGTDTRGASLPCRLLSKMGWKEGSGLGASATGMAAPIAASGASSEKRGLGAEQHGQINEGSAHLLKCVPLYIPQLHLRGWGVVCNALCMACSAQGHGQRLIALDLIVHIIIANSFVTADDDAFEQYRKRMMLGYKHRPNPLGNPRKSYY